MKLFIASLVLVTSLSSFAATPILPLPECKSRQGDEVDGSVKQLRNVMGNPKDSRTQVYVTGVIGEIEKEDHTGLPHQKFSLKVDTDITLAIVSNLDFGRIPLVAGKKVSICGEFRRIGKGMVHWTHFDPHGGHPDGFTILDGKVYGETEIK
ncbi:MAG: DUF3465 domain-containing protein [Bdellovibrionales bacterium]|nr:DUF3465 domain-containing protein [Bdellovibrionales bacterium]